MHVEVLHHTVYMNIYVFTLVCIRGGGPIQPDIYFLHLLLRQVNIFPFLL